MPTKTTSEVIPDKNVKVISEKDIPGGKEYTVEIAGMEFKISVTGSGKDTKVNVSYTSGGKDEPYKKSIGEVIAKGLQDALNIPEVAEMFQKYPKGAFFWLDHLFQNHFNEFCGIAGSVNDGNAEDYYDFFWSAAVGWAAACKIVISKENIDADDTLVEKLKNALQNGEWGIGAEEFLVMQGFWNAYWNSHVEGRDHVAGKLGTRTLDIDFSSKGIIKNLSDNIGLVDIIRINSVLWLISSANGKYMGGENNDLSSLVDGLETAIEVAITIFTELTGGVALAVSLGLTAASLIIDSFVNAKGDGYINNSGGVTVGMYKTERAAGLINPDMWYNIKDMFATIATSSGYFSMCLRNTGHMSDLQAGDAYKALNWYMGYMAASKGSSDSLQLVNYVFMVTGLKPELDEWYKYEKSRGYYMKNAPSYEAAGCLPSP